MKKPTALQFRSTAKSEVEAWLTIESNLADVASTLQRLLPILAKRRGRDIVHQDLTLVAPLYVYAVTWYLRCFATGRRVRLSIDDVPDLSKTDRKTHDEIRTLRNHHFAHPVTDQHEGTEVYLVVTDDKKTPLGFTSFYATLASESRAGIRRFLRLTRKVLKHARLTTRKVADRFAQSFFGGQASWDSTQYRSLKNLRAPGAHGSNQALKTDLRKRALPARSAA